MGGMRKTTKKVLLYSPSCTACYACLRFFQMAASSP